MTVHRIFVALWSTVLVLQDHVHGFNPLPGVPFHRAPQVQPQTAPIGGKSQPLLGRPIFLPPVAPGPSGSSFLPPLPPSDPALSATQQGQGIVATAAQEAKEQLWEDPRLPRVAQEEGIALQNTERAGAMQTSNVGGGAAQSDSSSWSLFAAGAFAGFAAAFLALRSRIWWQSSPIRYRGPRPDSRPVELELHPFAAPFSTQAMADTSLYPPGSTGTDTIYTASPELRGALQPHLVANFASTAGARILAETFLEDVATKFISDIKANELLSKIRGTPKSAEEAKVESAYLECRELTSEYAKTFFLATLGMEEHQARATWAIYAWCRRVDEIVDGPDVDPDPAVQRAALDEWRGRLDRMYRGDADNTGLDNFDVAFRDMIQTFPNSDIEPYRDMVRGMVMDIDQDVYTTWDDLYLYCYRVASTVGLMTLPVLGTAQGATVEEAKEPAVALGIALQITNILRDVGEDARDRGRIYLPQADLERFGVTTESILERAKNGGEPDDNYIALMKFEIERAREYYEQAEAGIALLAPGAQLPVAVASELYKGILDKIELNGYDNFNTRAYLTSEEKMRAVPLLWLKTVTGGWEKVRKQFETPGKAW